MVSNDVKELLLRVAWANYGKPYIWGGDDPIKGFDCSGFVIECLKSVGLLPHKGDWTAEGLRQKCKKSYIPDTGVPHAGDIVFYIKNGKAVHVELCIQNGYTIGASGGKSDTLSRDIAADQNAFIKVRPYNYRRNTIERYPFYILAGSDY